MGLFKKGTTAHIIQKPDNLSEGAWKVFVEGIDRKLSILTEAEDRQKQFYPIVAIEKTGNDTVAYYYNKDDSTWVDSIENATHFEKYDDAFNVWYQLANKNKENKERFARIFIPTMNENLLTEGIMDFDYADYYDGPGYYKFSFAISKPIDTKIPGVEGETISEYEDYQMISITSEKDFVDYITYELSLNEFRTFMGAFKMRDFYDYENNQESSNT